MRGDSVGKRNRWESAVLNNRTYKHYNNRLKELAVSMFEWKNVPDTVNIEFMEKTLYEQGKILFLKDDVIGFVALPFSVSGQLDIYNVPKGRRAYANNGYNANRNETNSVIIWNNYLHTNCINDIDLYCRKLYNIDRTVDVNVNGQKTPVLIQCNETQRLTMKNLYMQYDGNEPFIFGDKNLDLQGLKAIPTLAPFVGDKLMQLKFQIWNEAMTYLGISNVNMHKKERLLNDEVTRNMGSTVASRYTRLDMRQRACEEINKMFGLNMSVDYKEDVQIISDTVDNAIDENGGANNE